MAMFRLLCAASILLPFAAVAAPPAARVEPVTDDYYGTKVTDPYRWMESGKDPQWMPWLKGQANHTRSVLDQLPGRSKLLGDITARSGALASVNRAAIHGGNLFYQERPVGAEDYRLMVREGNGPARVLYDPASAAAGGMVIDDWSPSPDGSRVALSLSKRGTERSVLHIIDTATGKFGPEKISDVGGAMWTPDGGQVAYLKFIGEHGTPSYFVNNQMRLHRPGASGEDKLLPTRGLAGVPVRDAQFAYNLFKPGSDQALLFVRDGRSEFALYEAPLTDVVGGSAKWSRVADFSDTIEDASLSGTNLYLLSRKGNSNGRVLHLTRGISLSAARPINIPGNLVVEAVSAAKSGVFVKTLEGGVSGLWFAPLQGSPRKIALPMDGTLGWMENDPLADDGLIALGGWFTPTQVYHLAENGEVHDLQLAAPPPFDTANYEAKRAMARAKDGTMIPYTVLSRKILKATGGSPLLLEAYGSYGSSQTPRFRTALLPFLDRGGVYVMANVRGGGEFGRDWHYAGKAETKATTWRDAIAVAERLAADRIASPKTMTLIGTSAGGVMVGGAVNERPDLFSGAIANVGFMNPIRYVSEQNYADIEEWGGPIKDARTFKIMYDMDPYEHIKSGTKYSTLR